jgi:hypothetical protein
LWKEKCKKHNGRIEILECVSRNLKTYFGCNTSFPRVWVLLEFDVLHKFRV